VSHKLVQFGVCVCVWSVGARCRQPVVIVTLSCPILALSCWQQQRPENKSHIAENAVCRLGFTVAHR